jgi:hypothetical protein
MSIELCESFGMFPDGGISAADILGDKWILASAYGNDITIQDRTGGRKFARATGNYTSMTAALKNGGLSELWISCYFKFLAGGAGLSAQWGNLQTSLGANMGGPGQDNGKIVYRNSTSLKAIGAHSALQDDTVYHYKARVKFSETVGEVDLYLNGVLVASETGLNTSSLTASRYKLGQSYGSCHYTWVSDLVISTTDPGLPYVIYDPCDAAGSSSDFTPNGAATNHEAVDEVGPDEDSTYNRSTTGTDLDQLGHGSTPTAQSILAVESFARGKKESDGAETFKLGCLHSGNHGQSSDKILSASYQNFYELFEDVPGGSGWTNAQLQAAETSYENTTT